MAGFVHFPCPACGKKLRASDSVRGQVRACPCGAKVVVPTAPGPRGTPPTLLVASLVPPAPVAAANPREVEIYSDGDAVRITNCRAVIKNRTYSMANVSSVALWVIRPKLGCPVLMLVLGTVGAGLMAMLALYERDPFPAATMAAVPALVAVIGLVVVLVSRTQYAVRVTAARGMPGGRKEGRLGPVLESRMKRPGWMT